MGETWNRYKNFVSEATKKKAYYIYRGQSDSSWKLRTSFHRAIEGTDININKYLDNMLPLAHRLTCSWTNEIMDLSDRETFGCFLALLQHHGFPTPLLDWTLSPYIAVYFAFRDVPIMPLSDNVKVYIFDYVAWSTSFQQILELRSPIAHVSLLWPYARFNPRLIPQQGIYTITNQDNMDEYIEKRELEVTKKFLYSYEINVKEKLEILEELRLMGITEMALFPGLDGICRTAKNILFAKDIEATFGEWLKKMSEKGTANEQSVVQDSPQTQK